MFTDFKNPDNFLVTELSTTKDLQIEILFCVWSHTTHKFTL
jgi:hypothetical protein